MDADDIKAWYFGDAPVKAVYFNDEVVWSVASGGASGPLAVVGPSSDGNLWLAAAGASSPHLVADIDTSVAAPSWPPEGWKPHLQGGWLAAVGASSPHLIAIIDTEVAPEVSA